MSFKTAIGLVLTVGALSSPAAVAAAVPSCAGSPATLVGTSGDDTLVGTAGRDVIVGRGGNDVIRGLDGADALCGGAGNDRLAGGSGRDRLQGLSGADRLRGGPGADRLAGYGDGTRARSDGDDQMNGGGGDDLFDMDAPFPPDACCMSDPGRDRASGGRGDDLFAASAGNDFFDGGRGRRDGISFTLPTEADLAAGEAVAADGRDRLTGIEDMEGSHGDDVLIGDENSNRIFDGFESSGDDHIVGAGARDILTTSLGNDVVEGGAGHDQFDHYCCVENQDGDDVYIGGDDNDHFFAGQGGRDTFDGGFGNDKVLWPPVQDALFIDLAAGEARWRGQTSGIAGIEAVTGTAGPDEMYGDDLDNVLRGKDGDDFLDGRGSHDYLFGGNGTDSCVNGEVDTACET